MVGTVSIQILDISNKRLSLCHLLSKTFLTIFFRASEQIVERFIRHNECSNQNPSGISQLVLHKLLDESWGHDGYFKWLINLRLEYTRRRDVILAACEKFLPRDVVSWNPPMAGMFVSAGIIVPLLLRADHS